MNSWSVARAIAIGACMPILIGLAGCGGKHTSIAVDRISATTVYRGVFAQSFYPTLSGPINNCGTITLSISEDWNTAVTSAVIDSVDIQIVTERGRSIFPGRFDHSTGRITSSWPIPLSARSVDGRLEGKFEGNVLGGPFVAIPTSGREIPAYGGTWSESWPASESRGFLSIVVDGSRVFGVVAPLAGAPERIEGSRDSQGAFVLTFPGYRFTGTTSRYAIYGRYESSIDDRTGSWIINPLPY